MNNDVEGISKVKAVAKLKIASRHLIPWVEIHNKQPASG
jgi:hypothetical protein